MTSSIGDRVTVQTRVVEDAKKDYERAFGDVLLQKQELYKALGVLTKKQELYKREVAMLEDITASTIVYDKDGHLVLRG